MYILVALQMLSGLGTSLFWQPVGEFNSKKACMEAIEVLKKTKESKDGETYVCLAKGKYE
jgi:hypothetical protein